MVKNFSQMYKVSSADASISCNFKTSIVKSMNKLSIKNSQQEILNSTTDSISSSILNSSFTPEEVTSKSTSSNEKILRREVMKDVVYENYTKFLIVDCPNLFLGIPEDIINFVNSLIKFTNISQKNIFLTLKKLKLDLPNAVLAYEFGISESQVGKVFRKTLKGLATVLKKLIFWPEKKQIMLNLPIGFRFKFSKVQCLIDCFEIEIQKPTDAFYQALTWSDYKKCNTAKYYIVVTPCGLCIFISQGYGGRASDLSIIQNCGFLKVIPKGSVVMADRGFKGIDEELHNIGCELFRPPSVEANVQLSEADVILTKEIASLRIHVERAIERIRNFRFLDKHACVNSYLMDCLDDAVTVVAAITNLQSPIIKQY